TRSKRDWSSDVCSSDLTDLSELLQEADPSLDGAEIDFEALFKQMDGMLSDEDKEYLMDEYLMMVYNELPDEAFEKEDETVNVQRSEERRVGKECRSEG